MRLASFWNTHRRALLSYMMVGYPDYETSLEVFRTLLREGTHILEIGMPFSDPVADGPTIQQAHEKALRGGTKLAHLFELTYQLRREFPQVPFLAMTYYNPVFRKGVESFCMESAQAGIDGLIVPDLPFEEGRELKEACLKHGLSLVFLASPTSTDKRLKLIGDYSDHMVYFVSLTGTTGARESLPLRRLEERLRVYRSVCKKPAVVGFGISKPEQVREICRFAEGVVVGSHFVRLAGEGKLEELAKSVREMSRAVLEY